MILSTHYFRCHISWSPTSVFRIFWIPYSGYSKICKSEVPIAIENKIFRFDVSVDDSFIMHIFESKK